MATVTMEMVKDLRDKTGAGMMDCKTALTENNGDIGSVGRLAAQEGSRQGCQEVRTDRRRWPHRCRQRCASGAVIEVNSETDFVARNEKFQELVTEIARLALKVGGDFDKLAALDVHRRQSSASPITSRRLVGHHRREPVAAPQRRPQCQEGRRRRATCTRRYASGLGKIGVLVALESEADTEKLSRLRPPARHAHRRRQSDRCRCRRSRPDGGGARAGRLSRTGAAIRQVRRRGRKNGRGPPSQGVHAAGRAAAAGVRHRRQGNRRQHRQGEGKGTRQADQGSAVSSATRSAKASRRRKRISPPKWPQPSRGAEATAVAGTRRPTGGHPLSPRPASGAIIEIVIAKIASNRRVRRSKLARR